jgi:hypothetical protein
MGCSRSASPGFINVFLPQEVIGHVATCVTAAEVWKEINAMFASQSHARTIQLCTRPATTRKGDLSADAYYSKMKGIADEMAAAESHLWMKILSPTC